jgi:hypothetical protein
MTPTLKINSSIKSVTIRVPYYAIKRTEERIFKVYLLIFGLCGRNFGQLAPPQREREPCIQVAWRRFSIRHWDDCTDEKNTIIYSFIFSYRLAAHIYIQPFLSNAAEISPCWQRRSKREKCIKEA